MISWPCPLDSDKWLKSPAWGDCSIFAIFNAFFHQWWFHTLCRVQEAFSEVAVHLFPLKSLGILLSSLSQAKVNSFENPVLLVCTGKTLWPTKIKAFSEKHWHLDITLGEFLLALYCTALEGKTKLLCCLCQTIWGILERHRINILRAFEEIRGTVTQIWGWSFWGPWFLKLKLSLFKIKASSFCENSFDLLQ